MSIALDSVGTATYQAPAASQTFAHTCSGSNRLIAVVTSHEGSVQVTSITYNGVSLIDIDLVTSNATRAAAELWYLTAPATGANNVVITWSFALDGDKYSQAISFTGVSQGNPFYGFKTLSNNISDLAITASSSVDVTAKIDHVVLDILSIGNFSTEAPTRTGSGYTQHASAWTSPVGIGTSTNFSSGSVSMSWSWTTSCNSHHLAAIIKGDDVSDIDSLGSVQSQGLAASLTFAHTCSGSNRFLVVNSVTQGGVFATAVTYNAVSMAREVRGFDSATYFNALAEMWTLVDPTTGSNNVVITWDTALLGTKKCYAISFVGINTNFPVYARDYKATAGVDITAISINVNKNVSQFVLEVCCRVDGGSSNLGLPTNENQFLRIKDYTDPLQILSSTVFTGSGDLTIGYNQLQNAKAAYVYIVINAKRLFYGLDYEITRPISNVFRRLWIKRRLDATGLYETDWYEISEFVKNWGTSKRAIDDLRLNRFTQTGITLTMRNDTGAFNPEENTNSLWYTYLTRYRTLVKVEAGYTQDDGVELPEDPTQGIFIMSDEVPINSTNNDVNLQCKSLVSVFTEVKTTELITSAITLTASQFVERVKNHTDGSTNFIFRQFITSTAWTVQSTTTNYIFTPTDVTADNISVWDTMLKLAEAERFLLFINRTGGFEFRDRNERTSTSQFTFYGQGFREQNVIALNNYSENLNKVYNSFVVTYNGGNVVSGTTTVVTPLNKSWKYGSRIYELDIADFVSVTATAQTIADGLFADFSEVHNEVDLVCKFIPHLEISDKVTLNFRSYSAIGTTLWDLFNWDEANWAVEGDNFDINDGLFKILAVNTDLNNFKTSFVLREL